MRAINTEETEIFNYISQQADQLALVSTELNGVETACISYITRQGKDYFIQPLVVLINEGIMPMLKEPETE